MAQVLVLDVELGLGYRMSSVGGSGVLFEGVGFRIYR